MRNTQSGDQIVHLSVATSESWRDRQSGERREKTEWHRVVIFSQPLGDIAKQYLHKGSKVYIEGQLQTRKWTGQDGVEKYTTEVVLRPYRGELTMLDGRGDGGAARISGSRTTVRRRTNRRPRANPSPAPISTTRSRSRAE